MVSHKIHGRDIIIANYVQTLYDDKKTLSMITTGIIVHYIYYRQNIHSLNVGVSNQQPVEIPMITKHELTSILQTSLQNKVFPSS
ncbi:hypothetical protein HanIR_Chr11g0524871 [Helianthus annuus]|nr:hypothetical protein HanIR_Chr11g0524871 [Helianthus annuus]